LICLDQLPQVTLQARSHLNDRLYSRPQSVPRVFDLH
jgi:hypothetical protein